MQYRNTPHHTPPSPCLSCYWQDSCDAHRRIIGRSGSRTCCRGAYGCEHFVPGPLVDDSDFGEVDGMVYTASAAYELRIAEELDNYWQEIKEDER